MVVKLVAAPLVAVAWLFAARWVIDCVGVEGYAAYSIVAGIAVLIPFADLGTGAAVMDAMARRGRPGAVPVEKVLVTSIRMLLSMALALSSIALVGAALGTWSVLLGLPSVGSIDLGVGLAITVFALGLPLSVGPRLLIGGGANHTAVTFQTLAALLMAALVGIATLTTTSVVPYFVAPFLSTAVANGMALSLAVRRFGLGLTETLRDVFARGVEGARVRHIAGPMFVVSLVLPLAYQTDRIVLSHVGTLEDVAQYSIAFQLFSPLLGLISTAGIALWPVFARDRRPDSRGVARHRFLVADAAFAGFGLVLGLGLLVLGPPLSRLVSGQAVTVPLSLFLACAALLFVQAVLYPITMLLTDAEGLRIQAWLHVLMLAVNVPCSIALADALGAPGPVIASVIAVVLVLFVPLVARVVRVTSPE